MSAEVSSVFQAGLFTSGFMKKLIANKRAGSLVNTARLACKINGFSASDGSQKFMLDNHNGSLISKRHADKFLDTETATVLGNNQRVFRNRFEIRSYETAVDTDQISIDTIMNFLRELVIICLRGMGFQGGAGAVQSQQMEEQNLSWVVTKLEFEIDRYPVRGDTVLADTWVRLSGKTGIDILSTFYDIKTDEILLRASRSLVLIDFNTRRQCQFPEHVNEKLKAFQSDCCSPLTEKQSIKISKLNESTASHVCRGLTPRWTDMDLNHHVNDAKYANWMLQSVPEFLPKSHKISSLAMVYRRECALNVKLNSFTTLLSTKNDIDDGLLDDGVIDCQHLLQLENGLEILRGRTEWKPKSLCPIHPMWNLL